MLTSAAARPFAPPIRTEIEILLGTPSAPVLVRWRTWKEGRGAGGRDCYALGTPEGLVLVDPEEASPAEAGRLGAILARMGDRPIATLLTYTMHERASMRLRARQGTPVWAPRGRQHEFDEGEPDYLFDGGAVLPGGVRALTLLDDMHPVGPKGESFLLWIAPTGERVLFSYDRIVADVTPDGGPETQPPVLWLPMVLMDPLSPTQRAAQVEILKTALGRLLQENLDLICPAHFGVVMSRQPGDALAQALASGESFLPHPNGRYYVARPAR